MHLPAKLPLALALTALLIIAAFAVGLSVGAPSTAAETAASAEKTPDPQATDQTAAEAPPQPVEAPASEKTITAPTKAATPDKTSSAPDAPKDIPPAAMGLDEIIVGQENAPVTIIEYASLTCAHCAKFHTETFPKLKAEYIDTGKVKLIFREIAFDAVGLQAAALARCLPRERTQPFIATLFKQQGSWLRAEDPLKTVTQYARLAGLSEDAAAACQKDDALLTGISQIRVTAAQTHDVNATPTFILNDGKAKIEGNRSYDDFKKEIDALLPSN